MLKHKRQPKPHTPRSWIETNFQKRECVKFIPSAKDETRCCCGQARQLHPQIIGVEPGLQGDIWVPQKHTRAQPTDAYGTIEFQGGAHPTKAQYVRLSFDTRPELLVQLFTKEWNLELPKLLITVQGGKANFELQPKLKKEIRKGLLKAAKTTGAWIFTGGTNTGVTKQVGDALLLEGQQRSGRVVSIGIAPWGIVERNHELLGQNREVPCHSISSPRSKLAVLNNRHAYFLLVDNGTMGRYGAELILRRKLEKFISSLKLHPFTHSSTPVVCLVIEGGTNTIRAVLEYVTDTPPVPVVICDGSGRAADIIAFVHKYAADGEEQPVLESMRDYLISTIQKTFDVGYEQAEKLYHELLQCTRYKNLITVFRIQEKADGEPQELDQTILTALFKSQHLSPPEQLSLALTWNRVDIARSEIFVYGQEWPSGALDEAMMQALEHDRIDFVKLLLENGVSMKKFLTIPRLEELYNTKHGPANTLGYILRDVRPHIPKGYIYTLHDIGLVINKLMGGAYRSYYTRRKFRPIYAKVMNSYANAHRKSSTFQRYAGANSMSLVTGLLPFTSEMALFEFPFNELLMWAVLTKRQQMALLMWTHGEEALAKSLVACKLYKAMAHEAAEDDLDTEIYDELRNYAKEFETRGLKLLDFCYRQDADKAQRLLTCELHSWSSQSCLSLAVAANHRALLAHPCSQVILADLWMGGLRTRKNTNFKNMEHDTTVALKRKLSCTDSHRADIKLLKLEINANSLPDDILFEVFKFIPCLELYYSVALVCKRWRTITMHPSFWRRIELRASKHNKNLTVLSLSHFGGKTGNRFISSKIIKSVITRLPKLRALRLHDTTFRSVKFFEILGSQKFMLLRNKRPATLGYAISELENVLAMDSYAKPTRNFPLLLRCFTAVIPEVILGLLCPPFIKKLDFKSKEELQSMPQTEEEHLENQNLDYDDLDRSHPDAENALEKAKRSLSLRTRKGQNTPPAQALLADTYSIRDTKVQENGKVSLSESDPQQYRDFLNMSDYEVKQHQPLRMKKKIYEFYTAPITKFWADSIAYVFFLLMFTFTVLVKMEASPRWQEVYSIAYITTLGCEKIREIISSEPVAITHKFAVWAWNMWNPCDAAAIILFLIGLALRFRPNTMDIGRVIYCLDSIYWYLRILNILGVNKYLGPLVTMMGKMVKNMIYFVVLLAVVLMSFGVSRQAILFPNNDPNWRLIRDVYYQPYFMLYGEVFADDIDPPCGEDPSQPECVTGHWLTPITMAMYLLIANILLINLLIAVFNNIFIEVNAVSHQVWMFQRFTVVMEYQQKPVLPPPLIAFCHFYSMLKYFIRKAKGLEVPRDNGLKLFLEKDDLERLYDFEEECIEGYFHEQEIFFHQSTEERIKTTTDRVENMSQKIEDINQKENIQSATVQNIDFRLRKVEESAEQILSHLAVIHRFMSAHTQESLQASSTANLPVEMRHRTVSETDGMNVFQGNRSKFNRSLTEVRPDAFIFDDGTHFQVVPVPEENETIKTHDMLIEPLQMRKVSVQSEDSDIYPPPTTPRLPNIESTPKPPFLSIRQETTTSTESKDTLTPLATSDDHTLVGGDADSEENIMDLNFEIAKQRAMRHRTTSAVYRRNSESYSNHDLNRSQMSLNALFLSKRQLSITQSEPDSGNEPGSAKPVIPVKPRNMLLQFHTEYTSITDELESVCQLIASPTTSLTGGPERPKNRSDLSKAQFAALIEKQHLVECEENDYQILQDLFQERSVDTDDSVEVTSFDFSQRYPLRRETAIELSPSKPSGGSYKADSGTETIQRTRHLSTDVPPVRTQRSPSYMRTTSEFLNPTQPDQTIIFRKSSESLQKNSSTETDYSAQPYRVIKQSSNDTTTSMTGSFNIDNSSLANDMSLDAEVSNTTVIDTKSTTPLRTASFGGADLTRTSQSSDSQQPMRSAVLKKQYSVDQSKYSPQRTVSESDKTDMLTKGNVPGSVLKSSLKPPTTSKTGLNVLKESSSSTEESKDERTNIPKISTNLVQDEIAKLSSNIKSSTDSEKDPPYNETMC